MYPSAVPSNEMRDVPAWAIDIVLLLSGFATIVIYVIFALHARSVGIDSQAVTLLVLGWIPYGLACFAIGRRFGSPGPAPSMRPVDSGAILVVIALLASVALDAGGFDPTQVPLGHVVQAIAVFVGLALFGWGLGRRSAALDQLQDPEID